MPAANDGVMIILSSPSGAGKTTLVSLLSKLDNFEVLDFHRLKVGEGIELQKIDFREEVKSLTK